MKRFWVLLFFLPSLALAEIETLQVKQYCSFDSRLLPSSSVRMFGSDQSAQQAVQRIMRHAGVSTFTLKAASIPNAMAVIQNRQRYILYNQRFMRQVNNAARTDWAGLSILAHEIGHHLNGHTLVGGKNRQLEELQADHYSGFILQQMGASLEEATLAMKMIPGLEASVTHPARQERIDAIVNGWIEAEEVKGRPFKREQSAVPALPQNGDMQSTNREAGNALPATISLANNLTLVRIPAGGGEMGSYYSQSNNERPVHTVTIPRPFYMGKTEVTFAQYDAYAATGGKVMEHDAGWGRGTRPVIGVSRGDALAYAEWLSSNNQHGLRCRLPSESEWEYAARAGSVTKYPWGDHIGRNKANCDGCGSRWSNKKTAPVGSFSANDFGLHDMHGNVWEWVQDDWHDNYDGAPTDGSVWGDGSSAYVSVARGGSWDFSPNDLRSARRLAIPVPGMVGASFGFRIVCSSHF